MNDMSTELLIASALAGGSGGGGGGGGTTNYNALSNKPKINGVTLSGDQSASDLGIDTYDDTEIKNRVSAVETAVGEIDTEKLNGLADIKTIGTGLKLDTTGKLTATGGGGGDAVLSEDLTTSKAVGGIPVGKTYEAGTALEDVFKDMLNPVENPTLTNPSATLTTAGGTLIEEGVATSKTLTVNFNRGSINPAYGTSGFRSGAATGYSLNGGASQSGNTFTVTVDENNKTFTGRVDYAAGEQPKNSAGQNYNTPLPAGFVNTTALTFEIVAPIWSNAANIAVIEKEALVSKSAKVKRFDFPAQTATNPEVFDIRADWNVTAVELLNTLNNQWVDCSAEFTITDTTHDGLAYKRYTYNGGDATGARSVRVKWS